MTLSRFGKAHPFVRLLLPFLVGIVVADVGKGSMGIPFVTLFAVLLLVGLVMSWSAFKRTEYPWRAFFGLFVHLFFFLFGFILCAHRWERVSVGWSPSACVCKGVLVDVPEEKPRSIMCPVRLVGGGQTGSCWIPETKVLLYLSKEKEWSALQVGDTLCFHGVIKPPHNFSSEFDYVTYLHHHDVSGTLYTRRWQRIAATDTGLKEQALRLRRKVHDYYRSSGLDGDELAVLSALTLGCKSDLSEEVRTQYSISGASHVLALSGLHIGILCMVVTGIFGLFFHRHHRYRLSRLLAIPVVWAFILMVGSPSSAVRAGLMFTLLILGNCLTRVGYPLNTLALTAFVMLVYNPFYLFDVGFQMSFSAVASILLLQPWLQSLLPRPRHGIVRYFWDITTVSIAAQIGVFPLILHYFTRLSPYALLVNLWIVPLTFLVICVALPFLCAALLPCAPLQTLLGGLLDFLVRLMNSSLSLAARIPGADVSGVSLNTFGTVSLYCALFFLFYALIHKHLRAFIASLVCLCGVEASYIF